MSEFGQQRLPGLTGTGTAGSRVTKKAVVKADDGSDKTPFEYDRLLMKKTTSFFSVLFSLSLKKGRYIVGKSYRLCQSFPAFLAFNSCAP